jgi:hypothetical protein
MSLTLLPLLALVGCNPWNHMPDDAELGFDRDLWSADDAVALADGLYVRLPEAGGLARILADGTSEPIDVGEAEVREIVATPDPSRLVAFLRETRCEDEDVEAIEDCAEDETEIEDVLVVVADGAVATEISLDTAYNRLTFADDGRWALATLDLDEADLSQSGVISLNTVSVIDLDTAAAATVSVGFDAESVFWTTDASGAATRALVLSRNEIAVIDLLAPEPTTDTTFTLSLDSDFVVTPEYLSITNDGDSALIAIAGSSDLFEIDLVNPSINLVELDAVPYALLPLPEIDATLATFAGAAEIAIIDDATRAVETILLDDPAPNLVDAGDFQLLWNREGKHVYRFHPVTRELVEYRLQSGVLSLDVAPDGSAAVALTSAVGIGFPGMEILDLDDDEAVPYRLEGAGVGLAFTVDDGGTTELLLLQDDIDYLLRLDLQGGQMEEIELPAPPIAIGALPEGGPFWITHDAVLGMVSFLDGESLVSAAGFGLYGLSDPLTVVEEEQ